MGNQNQKKKKKRRLFEWKRKRTVKINKRIEKDKELKKRQKKILILGTGDSGKSTFVKQLQILYKDGFSKSEIKDYRNTIRFNLVSHIKLLIEAVDALELKYSSEKVQELAEEFLEVPPIERGVIEKDIVEDIKTLWSEKCIKKAFKRRSQFQIPDSASYFLDRVDTIVADDYMPDNNDIVLSRIPTAGIKKILFEINDIPFMVVDVGGQRAERRKWMNQFEDVHILIYVTAISEFDQKLFEDDTVNRLHESLSLFEKTISTEYFRQKDLMVILNKFDLFQEKLEEKDLSVCFEDFDLGNDVEKSVEYIKEQFRSRNTTRKRKILFQTTNATNPDDISKIFSLITTELL